ncbi:hypothetical protein ES703_48715 [subsurface metagenome]
MEAATQTTVPTVRAVAIPKISVHPRAKNKRLVPRRVTIVIPDVGFEDTPIMPTILDETVTKQKAKMTMQTEAIIRTRKVVLMPRIWGASIIMIITIRIPRPRTVMGRSVSVLFFWN